MRRGSTKGTLRRTLGLYTNIRIPWHLYLAQVLLGVIAAEAAMLYIPYQTEIKLGNIENAVLVWSYLGTMLLMHACNLLSRIPGFYAQLTVGRNLQRKLISRAVRLPMRVYEADASGMVSWITKDCAYADGLIGSAVNFLTGIFSAIIAMGRMSAINRTMLVVVPVIVSYILLSTWLEGRLLFLRQKAGKQADGRLTAFFAEHLGFLLNVKQLHTEQEERKRGFEAIERFYRTDIYMAALTLVNSLVSGSLTTVINVLIFVLGVPMVRRGSLGMEELVAFQNYVLLVYQYLSALPGLYTNVMYYNGELYYIAGLMAEKEEVFRRKHGMDMPDEDISFRNVSFGYGEKAVLKNAEFVIPKGKLTLVVGPNGSGKTTVFKLLERFYTPDSGGIFFGEHNAEDIHLREWRQSMTYVLQEPRLFDGTVRENILYGLDREVTEGELTGAASLACADGFIRDFPEGYEYEIGENGCRLSAGQRQRIAIARAVMMDPAYLLLDEATSNMDVYAEQEVHRALRKLMEGRTTVMITHNMKWLESADHVIVLKDGTVECSGTPAQAYQSSETLRQLVRAEKGS